MFIIKILILNFGCILKAAGKDKGGSTRLKTGGDVVWSETRWGYPVDSFSAYARVSTSLAHKADVEEKRKRADVEGNKKWDLRYSKKRESEAENKCHNLKCFIGDSNPRPNLEDSTHLTTTPS
mgnify:CR=1 FL=1